MKLIAGLGNPGEIYKDTRHNIGFSVVKHLAKAHGIVLKKGRNVFCGRGNIAGGDVLLVLPLTFMNLSGVAVNSLRKKHKIDLDKLLIVCDDLDLEFGRIKIRPGGSSGGHNGLSSVMDSLGSREVARLRIGVGRPGDDKYTDASEYVLAPFTRKEKDALPDTISKAVMCCELWVKEGVHKCMNIFNKRSRDE